MQPRERILRITSIYFAPCVLLVVVAACSSPAAPALDESAASATRKMVPYDEFADLQYYQVEGTNTLAIEFYDGRSTIPLVDANAQMVSADPPLFRVRIFANKEGAEPSKILWNNEGNAYFYVDVGPVDKAKLRVVYDDGQSQHDIPTAGLMDKPFEPEKPASKAPPASL
jgi:hypothetical protein